MSVPLSLLQTFVIVSRSGRMRDAASDLGVTPGAISQRIRELETRVGHRLFSRTRAGVELNEAGKALFVSLDEPFRRIEDASRTLDRSSVRRIQVSTMAAFAANWLVPRLRRFSRLHPEIEVVLETDNRVVDLRREPVDLAIRHGLGNYPGLEVAWLMAPELIVVASPEFLASNPPITTPADCLPFPLLHDLHRTDWRLWFQAHGVTAPHEMKGPSFSDDQLLVKAAISGQGLAIVRGVNAKDDLCAGRLVQAIDVKWQTQFAYYAVTTKEALQRAAVRNFREWLLEEAVNGSERP